VVIVKKGGILFAKIKIQIIGYKIIVKLKNSLRHT
jgi:hypothetical protein